MNLFEKKRHLIEIISNYLENKTSLSDLQQFAWEMIDCFKKSKENELPPYQDFEKTFWYTIWQIQHLADEEHEKDGITKKTLSEALDYLREKKVLPKDFIGMRP